VFVTNLSFVMDIYLQPDDVNFRLYDLIEFIVLNFQVLQYLVAKIKGLENPKGRFLASVHLPATVQLHLIFYL